MNSGRQKGEIINYLISSLFIVSALINPSFTSSAQNGGLKIPFIQTPPVIDGIPDEQLNNFEWRNFSYIEKTNVVNPDITVRYKIGYGLDYLYLIIESVNDTIVYRDRAYQNGDGFHIVIAKPAENHSADEFYVLRFSPANEYAKIPARRGVWYYNIVLSGKSLSEDTRFVCKSIKGTSYFELQLPWNEIPPYHPLFTDSIGINLCFVKAVKEKEKNYYYLKYDRNIQSELRNRDYLKAEFESPHSIIRSGSYTQVVRNNIRVNHDVQIKTVTVADTGSLLNYNYSVQSADRYIYLDVRKETKLSHETTSSVFTLPTEKLLPGGYKIVWKASDNSEGDIPITILPEIDYQKELDQLNHIKIKISEGEYNTLSFILKNLVQDYAKLKNYETAGAIRERYLVYCDYINSIKTGSDPFSEKRGVFRRAFLSKIDSTLQPYTVRIPPNYENSGKYPLFVMLHGSGEDDQHVLDNSLTEDRFIEIAPCGRGTSNCFTTDGAEIDVKEAIDDVIKNYPVDSSKIVIAGFSMGGYGAYRIFYEYPKLFKGVIVFSGHPNLASNWIGTGFPDFLDSRFLKPFKNIPLFIYHSKNDLNCPFDLTLDLVEKLKKAGAKVDFIPATGSGHGFIDKAHITLYYKWLRATITD